MPEFPLQIELLVFAFQEFVECPQWMHLDIAGVMHNTADVAYLPAGMAGRPTRTLVEFLHLLSQQ